MTRICLIGVISWSILASSAEMTDASGIRVLVFRVADLSCAVRAEAVREIVPGTDATRIPGATDAVIGLINVRGHLLTLVDARRALSYPPGEKRGPIVLLDVADRAVGLAVDSVVDLFSISSADLSETYDLPGLDSGVVEAVGRREKLSFVLLDIDALLIPILIE